jgi:hypothetical protein
MFELVFKLYSASSISMLDKRKLLGSTKVGTDSKILLLKNVAELLDVKKGDVVTFYEEKGNICIEKGYSSEHFHEHPRDV